MAVFTKITTEELQNKNAIFRELKGWRFDEGVWVTRDLQNKDFKLPRRDDIDSSSIPDSYFQSGVLGDRDLELDEINFVNEQELTGWAPGVIRGQYFSQRTRENLHGSDSQVTTVRDLTDEYDRSYINLELRPDLSVPITVQYLVRDNLTLAIEQDDPFTKVTRFRGIGVNGQELDTEADPAAIDTNFNQFKLIRNDSGPLTLSLNLEENLTAIDPPLYEIAFENSPVKWWPPQFERTDLFRRELSFDVFQSRQVDPIANGELEEGDYAVGYRGHWAEGLGVRVVVTDPPLDLGKVSFKTDYEARILFNKNVQVAQSETFSNLQNESVFYLTSFPVLDLTSFESSGFGNIILDVDSGTLTVDGNPWDRIADLDDADPADQVYQLDPLFGVIEFGDGGITRNGAAPVGEIIYTYTQVPFIQFDTYGNTDIFTDCEEDIDPQVNALRQGFLVLDNRRLIPYKITLTASAPFMLHEDGSCCYGPLNVPPLGQDDLILLRARVLARGNPPVGIPNIPVRFESLDGLLHFSQESTVTDGEGYAYTEVSGISNISNYIVTDHVYMAMEPGDPGALNPDPAELVAEIPPWGAHLPSPDVITFGERFDGDLDNVYLLIRSIPSATEGDLLDYTGDPAAVNEWLEPYNAVTRKGGVTVVWTQEVDGAQVLVHPTSATANAGNPEWTDFTFPINIPTGQLIVAYRIVIDRTARVRAVVDDPVLISNQLNVCLELNASARGQWKLPDLASPRNVDFLENPANNGNFDGSRISTAVFMSPNDIFVDYVEYNGGGDASEVAVGDSLVIVGQNFPTTDDLRAKVFIVRTDSEGDVVAIKNITEDCLFIDSEHIEIPSLPVPPTEEYEINYWIAVAGFPVTEDDGTRRTAWELEINES